MKTALITGCSSGFGLETARYFLDRDWKVIASMRTPREDVLPRSERLRVLALDVTDPASIDQAVDAVGSIDVLVNNAGIGMLGALEGTSMEIPESYAGLAQSVFAQWQQSSAITRALDVAEAVWRAANDPSCPVRIAAGADAVTLAGSS
jgi:NAD(P)-dependent dehydrogenase (short-subunit alcohol dehydrogenase family)